MVTSNTRVQASFAAPYADEYVKANFRTLGLESFTGSYWFHKIQVGINKVLPSTNWNFNLFSNCFSLACYLSMGLLLLSRNAEDRDTSCCQKWCQIEVNERDCIGIHLVLNSTVLFCLETRCISKAQRESALNKTNYSQHIRHTNFADTKKRHGPDVADYSFYVTRITPILCCTLGVC